MKIQYFTLNLTNSVLIWVMACRPWTVVCPDTKTQKHYRNLPVTYVGVWAVVLSAEEGDRLDMQDY